MSTSSHFIHEIDKNWSAPPGSQFKHSTKSFFFLLTIVESGRPKDRIKASLYALGIPILQGATSTILGVIGLGFAPSYLFVTFFKMIFLVIMLGAFHGMVLLPVLLSLMGPGSCTKTGDQGSTSTGKKSSIRSSGLSTPTLNAITCHRDPHKSLESQDSCYTVNLGYVSHEEPSQFVPYHYHQYLQRQQNNYSMQLQHQQDTINNRYVTKHRMLCRDNGVLPHLKLGVTNRFCRGPRL